MERVRTEVLGGWRALPAQLRFCLSVLWKRLFRHRRYPLLVLGSRRGGFLRTLQLMQRVRMTKAIRVGRHYHFSLQEPRWPSPAYDRMIARGGLSLAAAGTAAKLQIDLAVLAITRACAYRCAHCYERFNLRGPDAVSAVRWRAVIREIQEVGVSVVALSGGEPLARFEDTLWLLETADKSRSDFHLFTAGHGATPERVSALVRAGLAAVAVGLDDHDAGRYEHLRGRAGAFGDALQAIRLFRAAGILVYVNACLRRDLIEDGGLWRFYEFLNGLGVGAVQLLEPKPCGGYASRQVESLYGPAERRAVWAFFDEVTRSPRYSRYPAVYLPAWSEAPENLGCMMGGLSHLHIDSLGNLEPCVFLPISFGNVAREGFGTVYRRLRAAAPRPLHRRCPSLELADRVGFSPEQRPELPIPYESVREEWGRLYA